MATDAQPPRPAPARTAALVSVGCKVNQGELRQWGVSLARVGVKLVAQGEPADLAIVNTCTVTGEGDKSSRQAIRHAARANPDGYLVVTGCYASVDPKAVGDIDGVDLVVANDNKDEIVRQLVDIGLVPNVAPDLTDSADAADAWTHRSERPGWVTLMPGLERKARAFVKVQDGCNSHCTYCIVPAARGPQRSRPVQAIVDEVNLLYRLGYREAVLSGVQIGAYGRDWDRETRRVRKSGGPTLTELCERLLSETPMPRIRISSIQPQDWPDGFLDLWADPRMCRHLHLPLQSGSDTVLKRMVRRYRAADFRALVERVRTVMPEVAITADVMVGFPGETEAEHAESLALIREIAFSEQHVFRYSSRPGTAAARLPDDVPPPVKKRRSEEARALDAELRRAYKSRFLGRTMDVLWEEPASVPVPEDGDLVWSGLTDNYLRVFARGVLHEGQVTPVALQELAVDGIYGTVAQGELAWMTASSAASSAAPSQATSSTEISR
ncbi:MAG TPA: tRNA (N(6)-L-threonylcarbamoyladenosine(37)-C(2))-methylthiotransferase MtaB [Chloroflexota bacterium]|nr:tRNA (N(6)-L-threonylcarbamoyladenosine(37)-C(2))-methylthiotransferase MtaB [Chloroflexota bacterium]